MIDLWAYSFLLFSSVVFFHLLLWFGHNYQFRKLLYDPFLFFSFLFGLVFIFRPWLVIKEHVDLIEYGRLSYHVFLETTLYSSFSFTIIFISYWVSMLYSTKPVANAVLEDQITLTSRGYFCFLFITLLTIVSVYIDMVINGANFARDYGENRVGKFFFVGVLIREFSFCVLSVLSCYIFLYRADRLRKFILLLLALGLCVELVLSSGRGILFSIALMVGVLVVRKINRRKTAFLTIILGCVFAMLLPILGTVRVYILQGSDWKEAISNLFELQAIGNLLLQFSWDFSMWDVYQKAISHYDSSNFYYGYGLLSSFWGMVPRVIWESKPIYNGTMLLTTTDLYPGLQELNGTGLYATFIGEAFQNFGFSGVVVWSVLIGIFLQQIYCLISSRSIFKLAIGAMVMPFVYNTVRGGFDWVFMMFFFRAVPFLTLLFILKKLSKRR